jgi:ketosteroid isomerase-like protein
MSWDSRLSIPLGDVTCTLTLHEIFRTSADRRTNKKIVSILELLATLLLMKTFSAISVKYLVLKYLVLLIAISAPVVSFGQSDEEQIARAIERFRFVMVNPDSQVLADLASDDLEYVHSSGTVRDKKGFIDEFMKRWTNFTSVTILNQTIKISGDNAIVRHRLVADAVNPGYPSKLDIIILMVWRKEQGEWKMLARQAAKVPEK